MVLETNTQIQTNLIANTLPLILASLELSNLQSATWNDPEPCLMVEAHQEGTSDSFLDPCIDRSLLPPSPFEESEAQGGESHGTSPSSSEERSQRGS